ncbi:MAG TPA: hypothetical protein VLB27_12340 [candidate division Zixibacteria bacterium]|nr:hypothetical protein [candidate division Zixibacteria bacterium]
MSAKSPFVHRQKSRFGWLTTALLCLALFTAPRLRAQEVIIDGFPLGVGQSVDPDLFEKSREALQAIADSLARYPLLRGVVIGCADGAQYREHNDAKNPGLALGRAHALRNYLVFELGVDSSQLLVQSTDVPTFDSRYRYASVRLQWPEPAPEPEPVTLPEVSAAPAAHDLGLRIGAGLSSSPYGIIPLVSAGVVWDKTVYVEALGGHTFWKRTFAYQGQDLDTRRRLTGARIVYYPFERKSVGFVGGWLRVEEISQRFYQYVKLSEGPAVGVQVAPKDFLTITGLYNPAKHRTVGSAEAAEKYGQFVLSVAAHLGLGGAR